MHRPRLGAILRGAARAAPPTRGAHASTRAKKDDSHEPHFRLEAAVGAIVADAGLHARWLNTFSYLEYVGFRKIVKSQRAEALTAEILNHALEEGRHALGLKNIALKIGGETFATYAPANMLCGDEAEDYFQNLDAACDAIFADRPDAQRVKLVYCYVTWLIERRACFRTARLSISVASVFATSIRRTCRTVGMPASCSRKRRELCCAETYLRALETAQRSPRATF